MKGKRSEEKKTVAVLMSTYNGERFLQEQIESIFEQEDVEIELYIRDDGSSDATPEILKACQNSRIHICYGKNVGVGNSFMKLLQMVPLSCDYYAFSDQDDVWLSDKLIAAIKKIESESRPALYTSNQILTDAAGNQTGSRYTEEPNHSCWQILCNNHETGCTMVWNKELQGLLRDQKRVPHTALLKKRIHDVWVAMAAAVSGVLYYDEQAHILYRQHEQNVVGVKQTFILKQWIQKLHNPANRNGRSDLAREIYRCFGDIIVNAETLNRLYMYGFYRSHAGLKRHLLRDRSLLAYSHETGVMFSAKVMLNLF